MAAQFPDLVHALRPNPKNHIQEGWRILDFLSHHPESCHVLTWLLDDNGIPANWRQMEGYGVNTFKLINREGAEHLCKFHVLPKGGARSGVALPKSLTGGARCAAASRAQQLLIASCMCQCMRAGFQQQLPCSPAPGEGAR